MQIASARRETSRTCAGRRTCGFESARVLIWSSPTVDARITPAGAGEDGPTVESPAAGDRRGQRISDDTLGAIDLGHKPGFEPPAEDVGTAFG